MEITFFGATREVTGACFLVTIRGRRLLIDCGLIQGSARDEARNREALPFAPASIDAVVLSHAHLDHSGRLPILVRDGFRGKIYAQRATRDLCRIMLKDAAFVSERDAEAQNRRRARKGLRPLPPLYTQRDAQAALRRIRAIDYDEQVVILPGASVRLHDAGHILGSAIVELTLTDGGATRTLVYSGDLGHAGAPILRDPSRLSRADLVVLESTYGDRNHRTWEETVAELGAVFRDAGKRGGNILIPAFAVGRTQELLYFFRRYYEHWGLDQWNIFLDSPMAIEATEVYAHHWRLYDAEAAQEHHANGNAFDMPSLRFTRTAAQSMAINGMRSGAIVIAGSGMCDGGRIRHHLKHNVWRDECDIVIVGFQARGTTGRRLVDGARHIRLWGETMRVAARVHTIGGLSAHAGQQGLLDWYASFSGQPPVALVHGEPPAMDSLATALAARGVRVRQPGFGEQLSLL